MAQAAPKESPRHVPGLLLASARRFGGKAALGRRSSRGGPETTYRDLLEAASGVAAGLLSLGLEVGDRVGLVADNDADWLEADVGILLAGGVTVPRGADTAPSEVRFILEHSGARFALLEGEDLAQRIAAEHSRLPSLERIFLVKGEGAAIEGVETLEDLRARGREHLASYPHCVQERLASFGAEDLATIVYTSGTTAKPKGVMLTHANLLHNLAAVPEVLTVGPDDVFLSLLPSWHMFERILEYIALAQGALLVYSDPKRFKEDLKTVRPTVVAAVPRVWEVVHQGATSRLRTLGGPKKLLLDACLKLRGRVVRGEAGGLQRLLGRLMGAVLLGPFRKAMGGRLRLAVSGGGSLPRHVDELLQCLGVPLLNGYGLTETSPVVSVRDPKANCLGAIGRPLAGTEVEIRDENGRVLPPGETGLIWIRGPQVMKGYYKNQDATEQCFDGDRWFNSGDLGRLGEDGQLWITGRAKDTIVLAGGENVEPEPIETNLCVSPYILQAVVVGQDCKQPGALLVADTERLAEAVPRERWQPQDGVLRGEEVQALLRREVAALLSRENGFRPVDRLGPIRVLEQPFAKEDGSLTPTLKVKRRVVLERHAGLLEEMFGEGRSGGPGPGPRSGGEVRQRQARQAPRS